MKKKLIIAIGAAVVMISILSVVGRFLLQPEEEMLIYEVDGAEETVVDLAIQEESHVLYVRKIKLIAEQPTLGHVILAVNSSDEGIAIRLNDNHEIEQIGEFQNDTINQWKILIENEKVDEKNVWCIPVENYQGITFIRETIPREAG